MARTDYVTVSEIEHHTDLEYARTELLAIPGIQSARCVSFDFECSESARFALTTDLDPETLRARLQESGVCL